MANFPLDAANAVVLAGLIVVGLLGSSATGRAKDDTVAETIVSMERAALERWGKGDPDGYLEISANEVSYFDPYTEHRVDGLDALATRYGPVRGQISIVRFELLNPRVQVHGDSAVLTFNLVDQVLGADGETTTESRWNSTEVYARIAGEWRIVHSHWALTGHGGGQEETGE
jgi:ketosteroid isomerase-like protein